MNIAVIGSGGREHAIAWKLKQSPKVSQVFVLPGNGGTENNVPMDIQDFAAVKRWCTDEQIGLVFVGPEDPLTQGIVDAFKNTPIRVFGPDRSAARLEGSKIFAKRFMQQYGVATASFKEFDSLDNARQKIRDMKGRLVVKYDGLAGGKGVTVCSAVQEAEQAIKQIKNKYGPEARFIIEERLTGREVSVIGFTDGRHIQLLAPSQDHKPVYEGDTGPNTGGMGAYCPVPFLDEALMQTIRETVVEPTLKGIQAENMDYKGVIYFGLMLTETGPSLLEYNVRFGDPETEVILPAMQTDLFELTMACFDHQLKELTMTFNKGYWVDVVLVSGGYPGAYEKSKPINGLDDVPEDILVFHAGTRREHNHLLTSGGRVLNVVGCGQNLQQAINNTYQAVDQIHFENKYYRPDIGKKGLQ
ncbi:MAG: phosphoribosylamine--glycine ligase [Caldithrix sp.]|nr:phosphoribosylamine--glycine ligase [Caldithrix sp.]